MQASPIVNTTPEIVYGKPAPSALHQGAPHPAKCASDVQFSRMLDQMQLPAWQVDPQNLRIICVNEAACVSYGYSADEFRGMTLLDIWPEQSGREYKRRFIQLMHTGHRHKARTRHRRKDGSIIETDVYAHFTATELGEPRLIVIMIDVTEQVRAEAELRRANERFRLATEAVVSMIWEWDVDHDKVVCHGLERLVGSVERQNSANWWRARIHPEDFDCTEAAIQHALECQDSYKIEYRFQVASGEYRYFCEHGLIVREAGRAVRVIGNTRDVTERTQFELALEHEKREALTAKARAEEMNRLKSHFLSNMSHEIRTPLTAILGFANELSEFLGDSEHGCYASIIAASGSRLLTTINALLDHAKIEAGRVELVPVEVDARELVTTAASMLHSLAQQKGLELRLDMPTVPVNARLDPHYFEQILNNLIGNALKFTDAGSVTVSLRSGCAGEEPPVGFARCTFGTPLSGEDIFELQVTDTGVGISPEFLPSIFDEFRQESAGFSRRYEGTGLGLAISSKLAQAMGGGISVHSCPSVGSTFIVRLPLSA